MAELGIEILPQFLLFVFSSLVAILFYNSQKLPKNFPPGPRGYPLIGVYHRKKKVLHETFEDMRKQYGDIFSYKIGSLRCVVLNSYKILREAGTVNELNGKTQNNPAAIKMSDGAQKIQGIVFTTGKTHQSQRRFTMKNLRDLGFGRKSMEQYVHFEINETIDLFKKEVGKPVTFSLQFNGAMMNSIWAITAGERYPQRDELLGNLYSRINSDMTFIRKVLFYPWLPKVAKWLPFIFEKEAGEMKANADVTYEFIKASVKAHRETLQEDAPRDFIDKYLIEIQNETDPTSPFYGEEGERNMNSVLHNLFLAGSETTSTTLNWIVHLLCVYPKVQERMHQEVISVVGTSRLPSLSDRPMLPYTEALTFEVLRYTLLVQFMIHYTESDVTFRGFFLPKGTVILLNQVSTFMDKEFWGDPEHFRPERFLSADGTKVESKEAFMPFGVGKRSCLGETLAKDELFLFTAALAQRFNFQPAPCPNPPTKVEHQFGARPVAVPKTFPIIIKDRYD